MKKYGYILVESGLYVGVSTWYARKSKKHCLVVEKRNHIGRNVYRGGVEGIHTHKYDTHIFHTDNRKVWEFVNSLTEFNCHTSSPMASYKDQVYNTLFNMDTFNRMWGISTPDGAKAIIEKQRTEITGGSKNLEGQAIRLVGRGLYEELIKRYTGKQWGRDCRELPAFIIKCIPVRYIYDNSYFNNPYREIPIGGYNVIVRKLFEGCDIETSVDYLGHREHCDNLGETVVYTGTIDAFYGYRLGRLEYRSLRFEPRLLDQENHQGVAVVNYIDREAPYTRIIEHKHLEFNTQPRTVITREYPVSQQKGMGPYYPVNGQKSQELYQRHEELAEAESHVLFGGRLEEYEYYDMSKVIESAMSKVREISG